MHGDLLYGYLVFGVVGAGAMLLLLGGVLRRSWGGSWHARFGGIAIAMVVTVDMLQYNPAAALLLGLAVAGAVPRPVPVADPLNIGTQDARP